MLILATATIPGYTYPPTVHRLSRILLAPTGNMPRLQILQCVKASLDASKPQLTNSNRHKSYHPYLEKNKQRVREDEAKAAEAEMAKEQKRVEKVSTESIEPVSSCKCN